jgi:hypothetical protein
MIDEPGFEVVIILFISMKPILMSAIAKLILKKNNKIIIKIFFIRR